MSLRVSYRLVICLMLLLLPVPSLLAQDHSVPMEIRHNLPFVQVMVNGKGPFTFGIDTGTGGQALLSPDLIEQLNLTVVGQAEVGDPSGVNPRKVAVVGIDSLKVAGIEFEDLQAVQFQPSQREGRCDGILGFVLFRDYLLTLDYPGKKLTLGSGSLKPDGGNKVIPFTMPNNVPVIELSVGSQTIDAHLDSRGRGLSFPETFANGQKFAAAPVVIGRGHTVSNDFEIKGAQLAGDVRIGGYTFPQPFVEINSVLPVANFGAIPLQHFAVTFDQKDRLRRLESPEKTIVLPPPPPRPASPSAVQPPSALH
ncbi:MAG: aspartyl protease family protein [Candidatus Korobacteraceae bacterium]